MVFCLHHIYTMPPDLLLCKLACLVDGYSLYGARRALVAWQLKIVPRRVLL